MKSGELLLGHRGKGYDRNAAETQPPPTRPWAVVSPVHRALALLESLHETDLLFPTRLPGSGQRKSRAGARTWDTKKTNTELKRMLDWVNSTFTPVSGAPAIPPDPAKRLHASRFRRTLAYFIARRPCGLIAAALQYGHLKPKVTLNYAKAWELHQTGEKAQVTSSWGRLHGLRGYYELVGRSRHVAEAIPFDA
ncbi:hypothetical protein [Streptomyces sp. NPDC088261]|uniref:hypothetical protein n=1 Tax=Streptomyces sp. NPDC088261 TaxID=3365851 RepID=UPI00382C1DF0